MIETLTLKEKVINIVNSLGFNTVQEIIKNSISQGEVKVKFVIN